MDIEAFRVFCLSLHGAEENSPWTDPRYQNLITFTVGGKWFCLLDIENKFCDLKCPPEQIPELQSHYKGIQPAWHMNKTHWLKLILDSDVPDNTIHNLITQSYTLILNSLSKTYRP